MVRKCCTKAAKCDAKTARDSTGCHCPDGVAHRSRHILWCVARLDRDRVLGCALLALELEGWKEYHSAILVDGLRQNHHPGGRSRRSYCFNGTGNDDPGS